MSNPTEGDNYCVIVVADLFAKINAQRKLLHRSPVEDRAMASRCTLRFNVDKQRGIDFNAEKINVAWHELDMLEKMVNELFGIYFNGEVRRLCAKRKEPIAMPVSPPPLPAVTAMKPGKPVKGGLFSWFRNMFGG